MALRTTEAKNYIHGHCVIYTTCLKLEWVKLEIIMILATVIINVRLFWIRCEEPHTTWRYSVNVSIMDL